MATPWQRYINTELQKRIGFGTVPETGNATAGKYSRFTGTGLTIEEADSMDFENVYTVAKSGAIYTTVQAAIDATPDSIASLIIVYPGFYEENLVITNKFITLVGSSYATESTLVDDIFIYAMSGNVISTGEGNVFSEVKIYNLGISIGDPTTLLGLVGEGSISYSKITLADYFLLFFINCKLVVSNMTESMAPSISRAYIKSVDPVANGNDTLYISCNIRIYDSYAGDEELTYINTPNVADSGFAVSNCYIYLYLTYQAAKRNFAFGYGGAHGTELINDRFNGNTFDMVFEANSTQIIKILKLSGAQHLVELQNNKIRLFAYDSNMDPSGRIYIVYFDSTGLITINAIENDIYAHETRVAPQTYFIRSPDIGSPRTYNLTYNCLGSCNELEGSRIGTFNYVGQPVDIVKEETDYNISASPGGINGISRANHTHGTPRNRIVYASQAPTNPREGDLWIQS